MVVGGRLGTRCILQFMAFIYVCTACLRLHSCICHPGFLMIRGPAESDEELRRRHVHTNIPTDSDGLSSREDLEESILEQLKIFGLADEAE